MLIRLRDNVKYPSFGKACRNLIQNKRFSSIVSLTGATTGVRILYLTSNNLIPFFGTIILPLLVQKCTVRQVGVAWEQQVRRTISGAASWSGSEEHASLQLLSGFFSHL